MGQPSKKWLGLFIGVAVLTDNTFLDFAPEPARKIVVGADHVRLRQQAARSHFVPRCRRYPQLGRPSSRVTKAVGRLANRISAFRVVMLTHLGAKRPRPG
jgi:hypothetical protein